MIPGEKNNDYSAERGNKVISYVRSFLDDIIPVDEGSWKDITKINIEEKAYIFCWFKIFFKK